jgi:hypothetical protein
MLSLSVRPRSCVSPAPSGDTHVHVPRRLARACATSVLGILVVACATLHNTPAQDLAWSRWSACRAQLAGVDMRTVQPDGRLSFWYEKMGDREATLDCLQREAKGGPELPEPVWATRPRGP